MAILGDNTQGAGGTAAAGDRCIVTKVVAGADGTINSAGAYFGSGPGGLNVKVVLLNHAAGVPTTLVASSSASAVPGAGGLVTFTMSGSFTAGTYYLGIVYENFTAPDTNLSTDNGLSGQDTQLANGTYSYTTPGSWTGTDVTYVDQIVNVYIDYSPPAAEGVSVWYLTA